MISQPRDLSCEQALYSGGVKPRRLLSRQCLNCFFLALFLLGGLFAALAGPVRAELGQTHQHEQMASEVAAVMADGMPCCPTDPAETPECDVDCTTMRLCQAGYLANGPMKAFSLVVRPITASPGSARNDLPSAWRPFEPPSRPPRTCESTGA